MTLFAKLYVFFALKRGLIIYEQHFTNTSTQTSVDKMSPKGNFGVQFLGFQHFGTLLFVQGQILYICLKFKGCSSVHYFIVPFSVLRYSAFQ